MSTCQKLRNFGQRHRLLRSRRHTCVRATAARAPTRPGDPHRTPSRLARHSSYPYSGSNLVFNSLARRPNRTFNPHRPIPREA
jgi:hypothetical protein